MKNIENIKTVVFPVAGLGSRFLPATKSVAKELFPILNIPLIEYAVDEAKKSGIEKFIFVISREKLQVARHFETNSKLERELKSKNKKFLEVITKNRIPKNNIFKVFQERPLGLGHAIWCARKYIDGPFAVVLPDDLVFSNTPCIQQLVDIYKKHKTSVIGIQEVSMDRVNQYGIIKTDNQKTNDIMTIQDIVEKPSIKRAPSNLAIIGRYVLSYNIIEELSKKQTGVGGEIQLTDALKNSINTSRVLGYKFEGKRFDCGNVMGAIEAQVFAALKEDLYKKDMTKMLQKFLKKDY
ncbi:MAG: UTP--glucose-1-phosphate uridylyltransferase [Alphaproteobacteria bacterium MarineAlpha9_Bin2]|nr:MAG: UTP--glucose-1-phosphate uridylyltransferase [Alphaproteobacteria bacterium MarineAlpha9_Bin2]